MRIDTTVSDLSGLLETFQRHRHVEADELNEIRTKTDMTAEISSTIASLTTIKRLLFSHSSPPSSGSVLTSVI